MVSLFIINRAVIIYILLLLLLQIYKFIVNDFTLKIILLILNILATVVNQITFLTMNHAENKAQFALAVFCILGAIYILFTVAIIVGMFLTRKQYLKHKPVKTFVIVLLTQTITGVAGIMYFVGDKITTILASYGTSIGCDLDCILVSGDAGTALLVLSILFFRLTPLVVLKLQVITDTISKEDIMLINCSIWHNIAESMSLIVEFDAWFSIIARLPLQAPEFCPEHQLFVTWALYPITVVVYILVLICVVTPGVIELIRQGHDLIYSFVPPFIIVILLWFCTSVLLLSANVQPIGCLFDCDVVAGNFSNNCNQEGYYGSRIALLCLVLIIFGGIGIFLLHVAARETFVSRRQVVDQERENFNEITNTTGKEDEYEEPYEVVY